MSQCQTEQQKNALQVISVPTVGDHVQIGDSSRQVQHMVASSTWGSYAAQQLCGKTRARGSAISSNLIPPVQVQTHLHQYAHLREHYHVVNGLDRRRSAQPFPRHYLEVQFHHSCMGEEQQLQSSSTRGRARKKSARGSFRKHPAPAVETLLIRQPCSLPAPTTTHGPAPMAVERG